MLERHDKKEKFHSYLARVSPAPASGKIHREVETQKPPYRFEVDFLRSSMADGAELIPQVERTGGRSVRFVIDDYIKGFKLLRAVIYLAR